MLITFVCVAVESDSGLLVYHDVSVDDGLLVDHDVASVKMYIFSFDLPALYVRELFSLHLKSITP